MGWPKYEAFQEGYSLLNRLKTARDSVLTSSGESKPQEGLSEKMVSDKLILTKSNLDTLLDLIAERAKIQYENMKSIQLDILKCGSYLMAVTPGDGFFIDDPKRRASLEKEIAGLERDRRMERVNCWQDISRLSRDVLEAIQGQKSALTNYDLVSDEPIGSEVKK